jgi:hypothetical protein
VGVVDQNIKTEIPREHILKMGGDREKEREDDRTLSHPHLYTSGTVPGFLHE